MTEAQSYLLRSSHGDQGQCLEATKMANGKTRSWSVRDLRKKAEALQLPLRPLPGEASKGEAQINREQALLRRQR